LADLPVGWAIVLLENTTKLVVQALCLVQPLGQPRWHASLSIFSLGCLDSAGHNCTPCYIG